MASVKAYYPMRAITSNVPAGQAKMTSLHSFFLLMFTLLLAGFIIGYAIGGYSVQKSWEEYYAHTESLCKPEPNYLNYSFNSNLVFENQNR